MLKLVSLMLILLMTSGCCEFFGICTSAGVNVHTSAGSTDKFASSDLHDSLALSALSAPASVKSDVIPASTITSGPSDLSAD
jgi:hypothetical protein